MVRQLLKNLKNPFISASLIVAILLYTGLITPAERNPVKTFIPISQVTGIYGRVISNPSINAEKNRYTLTLSLENTESEKIKSGAKGNIKIQIDSAIVESVYPGKLWTLSEKSVYTETGNFLYCTGSWNKKNKIFICTNALNYKEISSSKFSIKKIRAKSRLVFKKLMYSWGNAGGLILALLSGSREYTETSISENFRKAGLSHILALSGMHLSFFAGMFGGISKKIFGHRASFWARLFGILFFVWFAGLSPSLFRALLVCIISILTGASYTSKTNLLSVLSAAFLIHTVTRPEDIFTYSFMLSYSALFGILIFSDFIKTFISHFLPAKTAGSIAASTGAQITTAPVSLYLFGTVAPGGILATTVMSPIINVFLFLAVFAIILSLAVPFLSAPFGSIMNLLYRLIYRLAVLFSKIPQIILEHK